LLKTKNQQTNSSPGGDFAETSIDGHVELHTVTKLGSLIGHEITHTSAVPNKTYHHRGIENWSMQVCISLAGCGTFVGFLFGFCAISCASK
jgi:hypothetical protein